MTITAKEIRALVEHELRQVRDQRVLRHIQRLLVEPKVVMRAWSYSTEHKEYPCWAVPSHPATNSGIAYCEFGFGPRSPWGLVTLSGSHTAIGMDCDERYSWTLASIPAVVTELPIWRVFKQENSTHPGTHLTENQLELHVERSVPIEEWTSGVVTTVLTRLWFAAMKPNQESEAQRMDRELPIRVTVLAPPPGVTFAIQRGKDELLLPSKVSARSWYST